MKGSKNLRTKPFYAIWAAVFVSMVYWISVLVPELSMTDDRPSTIWIYVFSFALFTQPIGYCIFERRYEGNSLLAYNAVFFTSVKLVGGVEMLLIWCLVAMFGRPSGSGFLYGVQFPFYLLIMYSIHFYILLIRIVVALLRQWVQGKGKNGWFRAACLAGGLLILVFLIHRIWGIVITFQESDGYGSKTVTSYDDDSYEYENAAQYTKRYDSERSRNYKEEESSEEEKEQTAEVEDSGMEDFGITELDPDIKVNQEEYDVLVKIADQIFGEKWEQAEVREWYAAEWICFENEYHLKSIDLEGKEELKGKLDLSRFRFLKKIRLSGSNVEEVVLPEHLKKLTGNVFTECKKLKKVTFGSKIKEISEDSFYWCEDLDEIVFQGDAPAVNEWISAWAEADIYYPASKKGWGEDYWKRYHMIPN